MTFRLRARTGAALTAVLLSAIGVIVLLATVWTIELVTSIKLGIAVIVWTMAYGLLGWKTLINRLEIYSDGYFLFLGHEIAVRIADISDITVKKGFFYKYMVINDIKGNHFHHIITFHAKSVGEVIKKLKDDSDFEKVHIGTRD